MRVVFLSGFLILGFGFFRGLSAANREALPDFSDGLPGMELVRQAGNGTTRVFVYSTMLGDKESRRSLEQFLGAGWKVRKLEMREMRLAADRGRQINGTVNLSVYVNPAFPETEIRTMHLNPKGPSGVPQEELNKVMEIAVIQLEAGESATP